MNTGSIMELPVALVNNVLVEEYYVILFFYFGIILLLLHGGSTRLTHNMISPEQDQT